MTPENIEALDAPPERMGEFARITGIFFEPKKTFTDIAERPGWLAPLILVIVSLMAVTAVMGQRIGWERLMRQQNATSSRMQQMSPEEQQRAFNLQVKFAAVGAYAVQLVGIPLWNLAVAGVLVGIAGGLMSGGVRFKQVYAIVCYSALPVVISAILTVVVIFLKDPDQFNMQNPLAFNLGAYMDPEGHKFAYAMASSMDLFNFWPLLLMATGLKAAAGRKLTFSGALVAVVAPWLVLVLAKSAATAMLG